MKQILFSELSVKLFLFTKQSLKFPLNVNRFRYGTKSVWTHIVIWEVNWEVIEPLKVALLITCIPYYYSYPWLQPDYNLTTTPDYNLTTTWLQPDYNPTTTRVHPDYNTWLQHLTTTWLQPDYSMILDIYLDTFWKGKIHPPPHFFPFQNGILIHCSIKLTFEM